MATPTFAPGDVKNSDDPGTQAAFGAPQWGIFTQDGEPVLVADSVASIQYARDYQISDYPQEKGAFQSYNKVQQPYQARVGYYIAESRVEFLNAVEAAVSSLDLVFINSPEIEYPSANLTHYDYRREVRNGVTLILVNVWAEEVRVVNPANTSTTTVQGSGSGESSTSTSSAASGDFSAGNVNSTNAASPTQSGQVQATPTGTNGSATFETGATSEAGVSASNVSITPSATASSGTSYSTDTWTTFTPEQKATIAQQGTASGASSAIASPRVLDNNMSPLNNVGSTIDRPSTLNGSVDVTYYGANPTIPGAF